jgi:hypothetical protein
MLPKKGIVFPNGENLGPYPVAVAYALKSELGSTHQAVKIVRRWTGAGERTVKNWLAGISGPSGPHLVDLIRHSDDVLEVLLLLAGRQHIVAGQKLVDVRNKLAETVEQKSPTSQNFRDLVLVLPKSLGRTRFTAWGRADSPSDGVTVCATLDLFRGDCQHDVSEQTLTLRLRFNLPQPSVSPAPVVLLVEERIEVQNAALIRIKKREG